MEFAVVLIIRMRGMVSNMTNKSTRITVIESDLCACLRNGVAPKINKKPLKFPTEFKMPQLIASPTPGVRPTSNS